MLLDVITRITIDTGLNLSDDRDRLISLVNRSAKEMYDRLECNKIYWERTVLVPKNKIITLPSYIGELRGMRTSLSEMPFDAYGMSSPRYVKKNWEYRWMNWRDLGESSVMQLPSLIGSLSIQSNPETNPVSILISGQTDKATRLEETVVLNQTVVQTVNSFGPNLYAISCVSPNRTSDITISDSNGIILAQLANCDNKTRYKMIDVSQFGWPQDSDDGNQSYIDILYKVPLRKLTQDTDSFPAGDDYDTAWYYGCLWQYYLNTQNKGQDASVFKNEMLQAMNAVKDGTEDRLMKKVNFGRNKFYDGVRNTINVDDAKHGNTRPYGFPYLNWDV